jgi:carboxypeptidase C (cathepsin A)
MSFRLPLLMNGIERYNGNFDLICNHLGTNAYIKLLEWPGAAAFNTAPRQVWRRAAVTYTRSAATTVTATGANTAIAANTATLVANITSVSSVRATHITTTGKGHVKSSGIASSSAGGGVEEMLTAGWVRQGGNVTQLVVANAGHMAPGDAPEACYDMLQRFITGTPFA